MKKLLTLLALSSLTLAPAISFADQSDCDATDLQCTYFVGSDKPKILKGTLTLNGQEMTMIQCFDSTTTISVDKSAIDSGQLHVGDTYSEDFRQCLDAQCKESIPLASSSHTVKTNGKGGYAIEPKYLEVKMDNEYGESCNMYPVAASINSMKISKK